MTDIRTLRRMVRERVPELYEAGGISALTGDASGSLSVIGADGQVIPGKIWVRRKDTRETVAVWGGASGANATVKLYYDEAGELYIARNVWRETAQTHGGSVHSIVQPPQDARYAVVEVPDFRFTPGRVTRSRQGGLWINVSSLTHRGGWFSAADEELSEAAVGSGMQALQIVSVDTAANAIAVTQGADMALGLLTTPEEMKAAAAAITTPAHYSRRGAVRVRDGQTALTDADIVDIRAWADENHRSPASRLFMKANYR